MAETKKALTLALGTTLVASLTASPALSAADNPFHMDPLKNGYQIAAADKGNDGKCGEVKCGSNSGKAKDGAGSKTDEGSCGANK